MNSRRERSLGASCGLATAILLLLADAVWSAPPIRIRPPTRAPVPTTPIRPPADAFVPPSAGPSIRSGIRPEELRGGSSFRPLPVAPFRPRPGSSDDEQRSEDRAAAGEESARGGLPIWLLVVIPVAGALLVLFVLVLLIDLVAKRRRGGAQRLSGTPGTS